MPAKIAFINNTALGDSLIDLLFIEYLIQSDLGVTLYCNILMKLKDYLPQIDIKKVDQLAIDKDVLATEYDLIIISWNRPLMLDFLRDPRFTDKVIIINEPSQREYLQSQGITVTKPNLSSGDEVVLSLIEHWNQLEYSPEQKINQLDGIDKLSQEVLGIKNPQRKINYKIPDGWVYQKYKKRVVICHSSAVAKRQWNPKKFAKLATSLKQKGFEPVFLLAPGEACPDIIKQHTHETLLLGDALQLIYESACFIGNNSGLAHLASSLQIPTVNIFSKKSKSHKLWEPAFFTSQNLEPPFSLWPSKNCRRNLVSVRSVLNVIFKKIE